MSFRSLYHIKQSLGRAESVLLSLKSIEKEFVEKEGQTAYEKVKEHCGNVVDKLKAEAKASPIGFRYTGTFYIRKPYSISVEYEKIEGSAYQREDLVSWQIENDKSRSQSYFRSIFKAPNMRSEISRADTKPVFIEEKQFAE